MVPSSQELEPPQNPGRFSISLVEQPVRGEYDAVVIAVSHHQFVLRGAKGIRSLTRDCGLV
jgi:UDP-N-acetyl-D-galactosamine dehydrogenase